MDFNKAKEVATSCLAMSTCGFILWTSQTHIQADTVNAQEQQVQQSQQTTKATTAEQFAAQTSATNEQQTDENYDQNDHGNYACLDSAKFNDQAQLTVSGWHATNAAQGRPYHYIIAYDSTNHREISRQNVTDQEVSRPDVQQVHNVYGASKSGFNVTFNLKQQLVNLQNVQIISRYTNDQAGNGNTADYWFAPITIDRDNYGNLDGAKVVDQQLQLSGWNANNLNGNKPYHYIILLDRTINREVSRVLVKNQLQRLDVEKAYPQIENAAQSGFSVLLNAKNINFSHKLQALSRFSGSADGNSNYVDFYFAPITTGNYANQGHLDRFSLSDGQNLTISGWHANDVANFETNHFLILFDNTANRQVISQVVPTVQRTDVAQAFPGIHQAGQSGFTTSFDLKNIRLTPGHSYSVVSRYSTSNAGNGGSGQYTDYWFSPITLNQQGAWLDSVKMTNNGLQVSGWMLSDHALNQPNAYIFVLNNGREVTRKKVTLSSRPDVAAKYGQAYNSQNSGFNTLLQLDPALINGNMQILLRFAADPAGNQNYTDVLSSSNYSSNAGYFDKINVTQNGVYVSGWHAANQSNKEKYQYLIAIDNQTGQELGRWQVPDARRLRSDVERTYPYILNSAHSGFQLGFNIPAKLQHHVVRFIHRYTNDVNGNGSYTDLYTGPVSINAYAQQLTSRWSQIAAAYGSPMAIAVQIQDSGEIISYTNVPGTRFISASTIKASVLSEILHNAGGNLNGYQQGLAARMIRNSDNDATTTLINTYLGGNYGLNHIYHDLGMNSTYTGEHWGWTLTTPEDQLKLLNEIYYRNGNSYLNDASRNYIKSLMGSVSADQNWGVSAGSSSFYLKNGWNVTGNQWNVSSIGYIPGRYTIAVYTRQPSYNVGRQLIESLASATRQIVG